MLSFKPSEFLHIMRKMERGIRDAVVELRAMNEALEKLEDIHKLLEEDEGGYTVAEYAEFLRRCDETTTTFGGIVIEDES